MMKRSELLDVIGCFTTLLIALVFVGCVCLAWYLGSESFLK